MKRVKRQIAKYLITFAAFMSIVLVGSMEVRAEEFNPGCSCSEASPHIIASSNTADKTKNSYYYLYGGTHYFKMENVNITKSGYSTLFNEARTDMGIFGQVLNKNYNGTVYFIIEGTNTIARDDSNVCPIKVGGTNVHLLGNGTLTVKNGICTSDSENADSAVISVKELNTTAFEGTLEVINEQNGTAIDANIVNLGSGTVKATANTHAIDSPTVNISGGTVEAESRNGVAIGGEAVDETSNQERYNISITGGTVIAESSTNVAIGYSGSPWNDAKMTITIGTQGSSNGPKVTATSGSGAAISVSESGNLYTKAEMNIHSGTVIASAASDAAAIGNMGGNCVINITGGKITAANPGGAGIGGMGSGSQLTITGGNITATGKDGAGIGGSASEWGELYLYGGTIDANLKNIDRGVVYSHLIAEDRITMNGGTVCYYNLGDKYQLAGVNFEVGSGWDTHNAALQLLEGVKDDYLLPKTLQVSESGNGKVTYDSTSGKIKLRTSQNQGLGLVTITPVDNPIIDVSNVTIDVEEGPFIYRGYEICPDVTVTYQEETLVENEDYIVQLSKIEGTSLTPADQAIDAGTYRITIELKGNFAGSWSKDFIIEQRELKLFPVENLSITYGDEIENPQKYVSVDRSFEMEGGLAIGEEISSVTLTPADTNVTNGTPVKLKISDVKVVNQSGKDVTSNYTIVCTDGELTITKRPLNVSLDSGSITKEYDGNTGVISDTSSVLTSDALVGDDVVLTAESFVYSDKNAGADKEVTAINITMTGDDSTNYELKNTTATDRHAEITPRNLVVKEITAEDKVYNGTTTAVIEEKTVENILENEVDHIDVDVTGSFAQKDVSGTKGAEAAIEVNLSYTITSTDDLKYPASNYQIDRVNSQSKTFAKIFPKAVTVSGIAAVDKIYDGTKNAALDSSEAAVSEIVGEETLNVIAAGSFVHKDVNKISENYVVIDSITLEDGNNSGIANNYYVDMENSQKAATAAIQPKDLEISGITAIDKIYDANTIAELVYDKVVLGNILDGESLEVQATGTFDTKNVGQNKTVAISNIQLKDKKDETNEETLFFASNYSVDTKNSQTETTASINQKDITVTVEVHDKQYDGKTDAEIKSAVLNGVFDGDKENVELINGTAEFANAGVADVEDAGTEIEVILGEFSISGNDAKNYNLTNPQPTDVKAYIYNRYTAQQSVDYMVNSNDWLNKEFEVTAAEGYMLSEADDYDGTNEGWSSKISRREDVTEGSLSFYVRNLTSGAISKVVTENYNIDKVEPAGKIKIAKNEWYEFLNFITFEKFFNETQTVTITASDDRSGIASVEYYESTEALTEEQVKNLAEDDWTEGDRVNVTLEDAKHFVYYARITDHAGNQICISSDGNVYDITAPQIHGIEDGTVYYTTQKFDVTEMNLQSVTVNDVEVTEYILAGNKNAEYRIVVTDKAGNHTEATVIMKPISELMTSVDDLKDQKVEPADKEEIDQVIEKLEEAIENPNITDEEKREAEKSKEDAENVLEEIMSSVIRLYGKTRYETALKVADALKVQLGVEQFETIIITSGEKFADALAGSYLAIQKNAPILMTNGKNIDALRDYVSANLINDGIIYILGGKEAVSEAVENAFEGYQVKRLEGPNRISTNLEILKEAGADNSEIMVCDAYEFADGLSVSATNKPILLVGDMLTDEQKEFLNANSGKKIYIIGGTKAVNETVEAELSNYGTVERIGGKNRYETSVMVAKKFFTDPDFLVLAYAKKFPDGLCGSVLAAKMNAPIILTDSSKETTDDAAIAYGEAYDLKGGAVLGGTGLISDETARGIFRLSEEDTIIVK